MEHITKHLPQQTQAPLLLELRRCATGEEHHLGTALNSCKIQDLTDTAPLVEVLRYAMMVVGLRAASLPCELETLVLIQYITRYYGGHTVEEIKLAFDMAVGGKLNVEVTCYENFSVAYFSSIMNAYREWARQAEPHIRPQQGQQQSKAQVGDEEFIKSVYKFYQSHRNWQILPPYAYDALEAILNLTREEKDRVKEIVDEAMGKEATKDSYKRWAVKEYFDRIASVCEEPFWAT